MYTHLTRKGCLCTVGGIVLELCLRKLYDPFGCIFKTLFFFQDQEHVKPQIVHNLANAELYCLAFANIYSDPNYHNLNHGGLLQTLARKGIALPDCPDAPLTETVLIKTTPIKLVRLFFN